jgi:hypothetical protein
MSYRAAGERLVAVPHASIVRFVLVLQRLHQFLAALPPLVPAGLIGGVAQAQSVPVDVRPDARQINRSDETSNLPLGAGEASTMGNGQPNANPNNPMLTKSKSERKMEKAVKEAEAKQRREIAVLGQTGARVGAEVGTPQVSPAGNPSVSKGGTPK